tara:strand:+ start:4480 stop:4746 length:267 start_codon:yes stop_codon:yes gene_type:complete
MKKELKLLCEDIIDEDVSREELKGYAQSYLKGILKDTCCLCGVEIKGYGNNALPIKDGECCDDCNLFKVVPARLSQTLDREEFLRRKR